MKTRAAILLLLVLPCLALAQEPPKVETVAIELKSGETIEGALKRVDDDGVTVVGADKIALFMRWGLVRGDKHYDLRKRAANFGRMDSLLKLADFCHDFAMDKEEGEVLKAAEELEPGHPEVGRRRAVMEGKPVETPVKPPVETPKSLKLKLVFEKEDAAALAFLKEKLDALGYVIVSGDDFSHQVKLELALTVTRNPTFFGAEVMAMVDGTLKSTVLSKGGGALKSDSYEVKDVRSEAKNAREQALKSAREQLLEKLVPDLDKLLTPLKK